MKTIPERVQQILKTLECAGYEAWCVGGAVRDLLLGREPGDWDVTTNALPETVMELFAPHAVATGLQHGTVTVGGGRGVEITTYRRDGEYLDNRRPESVEFTTSLCEDLARRDYTINAMAMDLHGNLYDPWGGQEDLAAGTIRAVGNPVARFGEDALRIMRGLRFAARLGFSIEPLTSEAIHRCAPLLQNIAVERLYVEMTGVLCGQYVAQVLLEYPDVIGVFLPEILPCVGFDQRSKYHIYDVWEHTVRSVEAVENTPILRWTMLLHDLGKPTTFTVDENGTGHFYGHFRESVEKAKAIMERLRFDNRSKQQILTLVERHDSELALTNRAVRRNLSRYGEETLRLLLAVKRADNLAQSPAYRSRQELLDQWEQLLQVELASGHCFSLAQLAVKGNDLLALGLRGKQIGDTLEELLSLVMEETLPNDRAVLMKYVKESV